ncbi:glycosyltransferase involved in cell wall biosynthesis [Rubricella aquisinus]|uniref:Glycosyltransferase involved in cell wall biosynthesis n=1 Tax=Rubricella aquisinus TaxID=2028108 RepID=A0A840WVC8_9RHOB|nr:glycosyltransferase [Rubricella aquisinus]MBB5515150.1 glycosyltransferase involved in cell wall biosynthesis [Rubricella aquisinus]
MSKPETKSLLPNHVAIIGRWPPDRSRAALMAGQAAAVLSDAGCMVTRWGLPGDLLAPLRLAAQTRTRAAQTRAKLAEGPAPDHVICFLGPILRNSTPWPERYRRLVLLHHMARGRRVEMVLPPIREATLLKAAAMVIFLARLWVCGARIGIWRPSRGIRPLLVSRFGLTRPVPAREALPLHPLLPADRAANAPMTLADLGLTDVLHRFLGAVLDSPTLLARRAQDQQGRAVAHRVTWAEDGTPVTAYMDHLAHVFHRHRATPDRRRGRKLLSWYLDGAVGRLPNAAVPIPQGLQDALAGAFRPKVTPPPTRPAERLANAFAALLDGQTGADGAEARFLRGSCGKDHGITRAMALSAVHFGFCGAKAEIPEWFAHRIVPRFPALADFMPALPPAPATITVIHDDGETGLARNGRMSRDAIARLGLDGPMPACRLTRPVMLYHVNADQIPQRIFTDPGPPGSYRIGYLLWEFDQMPKAHRLALDLLDEIWVPTHFVADIYRAHTDKPVVVMGKAIELAAITPTPPSSRFTAIMAFDAASSVARKNPLAAVNAFQAAFPDRTDDCRLLIKTTPIGAGHWGDPEGQMSEIHHRAAADPRIDVIHANWPFAKLMREIAAADVLLSPHRAEGFGYLPAFAMALQTPVIASDYSGTRDFLSADTGFPIPVTQTPVPREAMLYPCDGALWAEVDEAALAQTLAALRADPALARHKVTAAASLIARDYGPSRLSARYQARLMELGIMSPAQTGTEWSLAATPY